MKVTRRSSCSQTSDVLQWCNPVAELALLPLHFGSILWRLGSLCWASRARSSETSLKRHLTLTRTEYFAVLSQYYPARNSTCNIKCLRSDHWKRTFVIIFPILILNSHMRLVSYLCVSVTRLYASIKKWRKKTKSEEIDNFLWIDDCDHIIKWWF